MFKRSNVQTLDRLNAGSLERLHAQNAGTLLPGSAHGILGNQGIRREQHKGMLDCLADQDSVERVFVMMRKLCQMKDGLLGDGQRLDEVLRPLFRQETGRVFGQPEFAERPFDADLPAGSGAEKNFIAGIGECLSGGRGKLAAAADDPEKGAGVKQDVHSLAPANALIMSSGSGSKKLWSMVKSGYCLPARPMGRFSRNDSLTGRISATGLFRLQRTTVSPLATFSSALERWAFASLMFMLIMMLF